MPELDRDMSRLSLKDIARISSEYGLPPLETWNPPLSGHSLIQIKSDGRWWHDGRLIERENMVRLFSRILRREDDGSYVLVTPYEKQTVNVEDAPFIAVEVKSEGIGDQRILAFRLNVGDLVVAGPDHPLRFELVNKEPSPYLAVRSGLDAKIARPVFYELVDMALSGRDDPPAIWSNGRCFSMSAIA